ncbi:hypothetical protein [Pseudomonas sp. COR18]|uniref:hypothetical protein n=1 Tax=Pseudomonas sp. COR18 TaxID=3399680 RepID=UPI003B000165
MSYELPQKGNPHKLTVNQHTFPKTSIARFTGQSGMVQLFHMKTRKVLPMKPTDQVFCAKRTWDQKSEAVYMKAIEDAYQTLISTILAGRTKRIGLIEGIIISEFYCLWNIRALLKQRPITDQSLTDHGIIGVRRHYTKDEHERLEAAGVSAIRPDLTFPGRFLAGPKIMMNVDMAVEGMGDAKWGILQATDGEFIVPDNFNNRRIVPVSPTICLWSKTNQEIELLNRKAVAEINRAAIETSIDYYFARDLSRCPI